MMLLYTFVECILIFIYLNMHLVYECMNYQQNVYIVYSQNIWMYERVVGY